MLFKKKKILLTHGGTFHADDVFSAATLILLLEKRKESWKLIRMDRNDKNKDEILKDADFVFDIAGIYNPEKNRFDHHQIAGAGKRENGIEYASFGLLWKNFGMELCDNNKEVFESIDNSLVQSIDAVDNGQDIIKNIYEDVFSFGIGNIVGIFRSINNENDDKQFKKVLKIYKEILKRKILVTSKEIEEINYIKEKAEENLEKKILILDKNIPRSSFRKALLDYKNFLFIIYPSKSFTDWKVETLADEEMSFKTRKDFPEEWAGLKDKELQNITRIEDAIFCHRGRFLCVAKSKEGAEKLGELGISPSHEGERK